MINIYKNVKQKTKQKKNYKNFDRNFQMKIEINLQKSTREVMGYGDFVFFCLLYFNRECGRDGINKCRKL